MRVPNQIYKKVCVVCGKKFAAKRVHAKCCSSGCRSILSRDQQAVFVGLVVDPDRPTELAVATSNLVDEPVLYGYNSGIYHYGFSNESHYRQWLHEQSSYRTDIRYWKEFHTMRDNVTGKYEVWFNSGGLYSPKNFEEYLERLRKLYS